MHAVGADFTMTFRELSEIALTDLAKENFPEVSTVLLQGSCD